MSANNFPWEIRDVDPESTSELRKYYKKEHTNFVRVGPKGYFYPASYKEEAANIYNLKLRPTDIFVGAFPRSGSTMIREMVWIIANDWNFAKAESEIMIERFMLLEFAALIPDLQKNKVTNVTEGEDQTKLLETTITGSISKRIDEVNSPRFIITHLAQSLLPPSLLDTVKMVYVARDPRDVIVSFYYLNRLTEVIECDFDLKTYFNLFINHSIYWTPYFESVKEAWAKRHHPNMLFTFYEDVCKDLPSSIRQVASFLNKPFNEEQVSRLSEHLSFESFKKNKSVNFDFMYGFGVFIQGEQPYIRKGKVGGWRDYFDEEMTQQAEQWISDNLQDTDLQFPQT